MVVSDDDGFRGQVDGRKEDLPGMNWRTVSGPYGDIMDRNDLVPTVQVDGDEMLPWIVADEGAQQTGDLAGMLHRSFPVGLVALLPDKGK